MSNLNRPTWATVIAVLMIIFGVFGMLGSTQFMFMPKMLDFQESFLGKVFDQARHDDPESAAFLDEFEKMFDLPEWFGTFAVIFGLAGLLINGLYLFSGISLMQMKPFALKSVYWALGLCLTWAFVQSAVAFTLDSMMGIFLILGAVISIVIDLILLIVILASDKTTFVNLPTQQPVVRPSA